MSEPLWQPSRNRVADSNLTQFIAAVADDWGFQAADFNALHFWSVAEKEKFWQSVWSFTSVIAETRGSVVLADGAALPGARWFPEAQRKFAENLLRRRDEGGVTEVMASSTPRAVVFSALTTIGSFSIAST